jgi:hypothetical protein
MAIFTQCLEWTFEKFFFGLGIRVPINMVANSANRDSAFLLAETA